MKINEMEKEHKQKLYDMIAEDVQNGFPWADDILRNILIKKRFTNIVEAIDYEKYQEEIKLDDVDLMLQNFNILV